MADTAIPIGELSRRTGCNIETIRYYERIGLMPAPPRRGRYRSYGADDVGRLGFVRRARELGFTLDEVRALLGLAGGGHASCAEVRNLAASHLKDVRTRRTAFHRNFREIRRKSRRTVKTPRPRTPSVGACRHPITITVPWRRPS